MTKIKKMEVVGPFGITARDVQFALRFLAVGVVVFMAWEICQGKV